MIIKEIKLDCFRSYEFSEIPINKGINLFYGDNGSGKSSIIESIYFSLTGKSFRTNDTNNLIQKNKNQTQTLIVFEEGNTVKITKKRDNRSQISQNRGEKTRNFTKLHINSITGSGDISSSAIIEANQFKINRSGYDHFRLRQSSGTGLEF